MAASTTRSPTTSSRAWAISRAPTRCRSRRSSPARPLRAPAVLAAVHRPGDCLFAQGDAQPRPVRDNHPAVADLEVFAEERVQPVEVLDPGFVRVGGREMEVN